MSLKNYSIRILFFFIVLFFSKDLFAQVTDQTMQQIQLLLNEKSSRTPTQQKIDSRLLQAVRESRGEKMVEGVSLEPANVGADFSGRLKVDISAEITDAFLSKIRSLGGQIIYPSAEYHTVRVLVSLSTVETIAGYPEVKFIEPAVRSMLSDVGKNDEKAKRSYADRVARVRAQLTAYLQQQEGNIGSVTSQGDAAHRAADVRTTYGFTGAGIKIGVLSDSYNALGGAAADVTSGDLPGTGNPQGYTTPVTVVQDYSGGEDEGRAMLQVVHDLAPGAQLFFATADVSEAGFATNIKALRRTYNCNIIIDDVNYFDEPAFQDGITALAVDTVTSLGALYFSAAGNSGALIKGTSGVFEGDFNSTGSSTFSGSSKAGTIHNFGTASSPVNGDIIKTTGEIYNLTWSDPWGLSGNDYDLFLVSSTGTVKSSSTNVQSGTQNPYEQITVKTLATGDRLVVFKTTAAAVRAFHLNTNRGTLTVATNGQTTGHACAINAFCMAATPAATQFASGYPTGPYPNPFVSTNLLEPFSSDGPRRIFYNPNGTAITAGNFLFGTNGGTSLAKPDLTAADGVSTTLGSSSGLNPFFGTSCAAPHAGAIAALLLSANPSLTPAQVRTLLTTTALDIEGPGYENNSGYGIIQAFQAMQALAIPTITVSSPLTPTSETTTYGTPSASMTFSVSGANMTAGILITPPAGFEVCLTSAGTYTSTVTVGAAGTIASTPVYVRLKVTDAVSNYSGNVGCTSSGATTQNAAIANSSVTAAPLTITANNGIKTYGQTFTTGIGSVNFTANGLKNSETIGSITIVSTGAVANATVAGSPYTIVPSAATGGTFTASNYSITYTNGTLTVNKAALTITANNGTKTYGQIFVTGQGSANFTASGLQNNEAVGNITIASTGAVATATVAGSPYAIVPTAAAGGTFTANNYSIAYINGTLVVGTAALTITANNGTKTYGQIFTTGAGSTNFITNGLQNSETVGTITVASTGAAATAAIGSYNIIPIAATGGTFSVSNYSITYNPGTLIVGPAALTVTASAQSKTYGGTALTTGTLNTNFTVTGLQNSDAANTNGATLTYSGSPAGNLAIAAVGAYTITPSALTLSTGSTANYSVSYTIGTLTVGKANATINVTPYSVTYDGNPHTATGTATGVLSEDLSSLLTLSATTHTNAGTYNGDGWSFAGNSNYNAASGTVNDLINAASSTISVTGGTTFTYNGTSQGPSGISESGSTGAQSLSYVGVSGTTYGPSATAPVNAGSYTATATVAADANYSGATSAPYAFTIAQATATINVTPYNVTYDGNPHTATGTATGVLSEDLSSLLNLSGTTHTAAGTYNNDPWTFTGNTNYSSANGTVNDVIGSANSTIVMTGATSFTYNGGPQGPSTSTESGSTGAITYSYSGTNSTSYGPSATQPTNAGTYSATATVASDGIYNGATSAPYAFTIAQATATINVTAYNVIYDGNPHTATGTATGVLSEDLSSLLNLSGTTHTAAGTYNGDGWSFAGNTNYNTASGTVNDLISAGSSTITVTGGTVYTYNNTPQGPASVSETGSTGGVTYSYAGTNSTSYGPSGTAPTNAGTYAVTATVAGDANYNGATSAPYGFAINGAPLTITANNITKCNGATYVFTGTEFTTSGLINGDGSSVTNVSLASAGAASGAAAGNYDIIPSAVVTGTGLSNYAISYVNGTLTVETPVSVTMIQTNPDCHGNPGSLTSTVSGGISPYSYKVNTGLNYDPSGTFVSNPLFTPLAAGYYAYAAKDANDCLGIAPGITIAPFTKQPILINNATAPLTVPVCYGSTVTIETTCVGGSGPFTYSLDGGAFVSAANRYFTVGAGNYYITVLDNLGCSYNTDTITVSQPLQPLAISSAVTNLNCNNSTGAITISATGGYSGSYTYSDNNGTSFQVSNTFTGLAAGNYSLVVKDANGCTISGTATVKASTFIASAISGNLQACFGANTTISSTGAGGTSPYTYSLDNTNSFVSSANRYFSVGAGTHTIAIMDAGGCMVTTAPVTVIQPSAKTSFTAVAGGAGCTNNGNISITALNGYGGYSYSDNGGTSYQAGAVFTGLAYGSYTVAVKDQNGCAATTAVVKLVALTSSTVQGNLTVCTGGTTTLSIVPSGGIAPYTYSLDGGNFVPSANRYFNVKAGSHYITAEDNAGCTYTPPAINVTTVSCPNGITNVTNNKTVPASFEVKVSPNPSQGAFHVQMKSSSREDVEMIVTNVMGEKVYETKGRIEETYQFGAEFTGGIYILQIRQGNALHTVKLVKGN